MGVQGLWQLLYPTGQPVTLESLHGKVLAVDISMWLHQTSKGMRDRHGNPVPNAHLLGLFRRICKLLYYHVKPIVVFDGGAPVLKRQVLMNRRQLREEAVANSSRSSKKLITKLLKYHVIGSAVGLSQDSSKVPSIPASIESAERDLFQLPPLPSAPLDGNIVEKDQSVHDGKQWEDCLERRTQYYTEMKERHKYDIESEDFEALPLDVKHEILTELKDSNKRTDWESISSLPKDSGDFSSFQLNRLIHHNKVSQLLENVRQEMNYSVTGLGGLVDPDNSSGVTIVSDRLASDETAQYVLIKPSASASQDTISTFDDTADKTKNDGENNEDELTVDENIGGKKNFRMNTAFAIRKVVKDKNAGRKFAPVCVVKLSSSSSSSDEEEVIKRPKNSRKIIDDELQETRESSDASLKKLTPASYQESKVLQNENSCAGRVQNTRNSTVIAGQSDQTCQIVARPAGKTVPVTSSKREDTQLSVTKQVGFYVGDESSADFEKAAVSSRGELVDNVNLKQSDVGFDDSGSGNLQRNAETGELWYETAADGKSVSQETSVLKIKIDPNYAAVSDDLFPASVFNRPVSDDAVAIESSDSSVEHDLTSGFERNESLPSFADDFAAGNDDVDDAIRELDNPFTGMTKEGLINMQNDLAVETTQLQQERGKQERLASGITNQMQSDAQELLQLFGVPYIVSPMEAEAQCAYLDVTDQTDGTITDDSDIWLFGGRRVYKNLFNQDREVELYTLENIESVMSLDRDLLINIALLCGSDYTEGIPGVGSITALELLADFHGSGFEKLINFAEWWNDVQEGRVSNASSLSRIRKRLCQLHVHEGFPNRAVVNAYLNPEVDNSREPFSWGEIDVDALRLYACTKLGWSQSQTDELLMPLLKRRKKIEIQTQLTSYNFAVEKRPINKRIQNILSLLKLGRCGAASKAKNQQRSKRRRTTKSRRNGGGSSSSASDGEASGANSDGSNKNDGGFFRKRRSASSRPQIIESDDDDMPQSSAATSIIVDSD